MRQLRWIIVMVCVCACARLVFAESLWPAKGDSLYKDKKAFKVGDVITIEVVESASASHRADARSRKKSSSSISWGAQRSGASRPTDFGLTGREDVVGGGRSERSGVLRGRLTVRVVQVLPNGNLVINGNRVITVNDERQVMEVTGMVRPEDVTTDNTVLSTHIADAQIKYSGKGPATEKARLGLLSRLLSMLFIF